MSRSNHVRTRLLPAMAAGAILWLAPYPPSAPDGPGTAQAADLSSADWDLDVDFEADDILALNMSNASKATARALGFRVRNAQALRNLGLWLVRLRAPPGMNTRAALDRLRASDPEGFYGLNESYVLAGAPASCKGVRCYGAAMVGWEATGCLIEARIGMVDSALNPESPALTGRAIHTRRFSPTRPSEAELRHGSAIASLLVGATTADTPGLLPRAELHAADVFSMDRDGKLTTDAARVTAGLDWLSGVKPQVINLSLEGPDSGILRVAIRRLIEQGISIVAAAGNHGPQAPPQYPGAFPGVIAVTAVDRFGQVYALANQGDYIGLAAPGVGIWTADDRGSGVFMDGTSFAAPFVTAAATQLRRQHPELGPDAIAQRLRGLSRDLGAPGPDPVYGAGLLQALPCATASVAAATE